MTDYIALNTYLKEYSEKNTDNKYRPVAVGRYGIRTRESIYTKELATDYSKNKVIRKNTLTVGMGSKQIDIGILSEEKCYSVSPAYHTYTIYGINPDYLRYCLECRNLDMFDRYVKRGSRQGKTIDLKRWLTYKIPVHENSKQIDIVYKLDKVSEIIEFRKSQIEKLNDLIKSRFIELFGDLDNNKWDVYKMSEITSSRLGKMLDKNKQKGDHLYPYLANFNVQWFFFKLDSLNLMDFSLKDKEEFSLIDGDLLVCEGGEIGRCAIWHNEITPCFFQKALHRIRCNTDIIIPEYLAWWFKFKTEQNNFSNTIGGKSTILHLTGIKLKSLSVSTPPMKLQIKFKVFVQQVDKSKLAVEKSLEELETLKKSLMQKYFG